MDSINVSGSNQCKSWWDIVYCAHLLCPLNYNCLVVSLVSYSCIGEKYNLLLWSACSRGCWAGLYKVLWDSVYFYWCYISKLKLKSRKTAKMTIKLLKLINQVKRFQHCTQKCDHISWCTHVTLNISRKAAKNSWIIPFLNSLGSLAECLNKHLIQWKTIQL